MKVLQLTAKSGADGLLKLSIPVEPGQEFDVNITLESRDAPPEERGWPPGYFEATFGSIQDERFIAPDRSPARFDGRLE
jgi:hypothetical protein